MQRSHEPEKIELPLVLDPDRPRLEGDLSIEDAKEQAQQLDGALDQACDYGRSLWRQLDAVRRYLVVALPDPDATDDEHRLLTAPRGGTDDEGWTAWRQAYAGATSVLAGPRSDEGYGAHEARQFELACRGTLASERWAMLRRISTAGRVEVETSRRAWTDEDPALAPDEGAPGIGPERRRQLVVTAVVAVVVGAFTGWSAGRSGAGRSAGRPNG